MKKKITSLLIAVCFLLSACATAWMPEAPAPESRGRAKHIILFIGDGMHLAHETAASRYLYGSDRELSFHKFQYKGFVATWDVNTYNRYAFAGGSPFYHPSDFRPRIGYDPFLGGLEPDPSQSTDIHEAYFLTKLPLSERKELQADRPGNHPGCSARGRDRRRVSRSRWKHFGRIQVSRQRGI